MKQPWYWYVKQHDYTGETSVQIRTAPAGSVCARWWIIPFTDHNYDRWNVYLEPKWIAERRQPLSWGLAMDDEVYPEVTLDCEWVFHHREKWEPPPKRAYEYQAEVCECCGQEIQI